MANETKKNLSEQELNEVAGSSAQFIINGDLGTGIDILGVDTGKGEKITDAVDMSSQKDGGKGMINPKYDPRYKDLFNK